MKGNVIAKIIAWNLFWCSLAVVVLVRINSLPSCKVEPIAVPVPLERTTRLVSPSTGCMQHTCP